jgi:hypothetical protein
MAANGFNVVVGNPPWGQKAIRDNPSIKQYIQAKYPSSRGIYDIFRPFVEQSIRLLSPGGIFGLVLPDIVLLKNYAATRHFLLEQLALTRIDWWGMAFESACIDAASILGVKSTPPEGHRVLVRVHRPEPIQNEIPQADFWSNPRFAFNLYLGPEKRRILSRLDDAPKIGDFFEIHEGVHSGNIRQQLFVSTNVDHTCRELYVNGGDIQPFHLRWQGQFIHLAALPTSKTRRRYANLGKTEWHECEKVLVRRTGDHVLAAVDSACRYASNNFFVVFSGQPCLLRLHGLCALLNSRFMTWYFRTIEPRQGRAFAELKIKHLSVFPLPVVALQADGCELLNKLGAQRADLAAQLASVNTARAKTVIGARIAVADRRLDELVNEFYLVTTKEMQ